ncbi:hypothetical protein AZH11_04280 [Pseudomonas simiae]|nr:hypothetical protein AZH11_04280 [Pseudomonas simiae]
MKYEIVDLKIEGDLVVECLKQNLSGRMAVVGRSRPLSDFTAGSVMPTVGRRIKLSEACEEYQCLGFVLVLVVVSSGIVATHAFVRTF